MTAAYHGIEEGSYEILVDELSRTVRAGLSGPLDGLYPALARTA